MPSETKGSTRIAWGRGILLLLLLGFLLPAALWAQGSRGTITGFVRDTSGAVVPGVSITVTNQQTGSTLSVKSLGDGAYRAPQLLPGNYTVSAEHSGFKKIEIKGLKLDVSSTLTQDLQLEIGTVEETVVVTAETSLVETTSGEAATTVPIDHVLEMPLVDRDVFSLVALTPGALYRTGNQQPKIYVNGSRGWESTTSLDGTANLASALNVLTIQMSPPVDAVQEFRVQSSNYAAEFGRSQGTTINGATKSGTNQFHGVFYEFLRNDKLDAAGWGADTKPPLRRNNFGGTIGGPISRNKAFFFYNYDGLRERGGAAVTRNVGLPEWQTGDFSRATRQAGGTAALVPIYDPATGTGTPAAPRDNTPFPNNIIPALRLDPVALKMISFLPDPNRTPDNSFNQAGNWQLNRVNTVTQDLHIGRVDYEWTNNTKVFYRIFFQPENDVQTPEMEGWGPADPNFRLRDGTNHNHVLNLTHLFSPTVFANFTMGYNRRTDLNKFGGCCGTDFSELLGIPKPTGLQGFPLLGYQGGQVPVTQVGATTATSGAPSWNWQWNGNFTHVKDNHTLKYGFSHARHGAGTQVVGVGNWAFDGRITRGVTGTGSAVPNTGINMADALLGQPVEVNFSEQPHIGKRIQYYGGYFQDDWRVTSNLTLNLGIRYDTETPPYEVAGRHANFEPFAPNPLAGTGDIPAGAFGITSFQNRNGFGKYLTNWDKNNFAPRFGFAYRVTGSNNTTIRGGYGLYYGAFAADAPIQAGQGPFARSYVAGHPVPFLVRNGLPDIALALQPDSELTPTWGNRGTTFARASAVAFLDPARVTPYSQNFSLTIQHQWRDILFEVGYRGNLGTHLMVGDKNLNTIRPELLSRTEIPERLRRPWTIFTSDQGVVRETNANWGRASYHAFVFKSERRFSNGFGWIVSYAWSKQIDNGTYVGGTQLAGDNDQDQSLYVRSLEKSVSTGDVPHNLVFSPIVDLPFGEGRRWLNRGGVANALAGGWQISMIGTLQSGSPFGVIVNNGSRDLLGDSRATLRPNLLSDPNSSQQGTPAAGVRGLQWLDPVAFANPAPFTFGTASRTLPGVSTPGTVSFDMMLAKNFAFLERWRVQFRWELFNAFNTPQFARPADVFGAGNFGVVTSAGGRRIMQFGLKLYW